MLFNFDLKTAPDLCLRQGYFSCAFLTWSAVGLVFRLMFCSNAKKSVFSSMASQLFLGRGPFLLSLLHVPSCSGLFYLTSFLCYASDFTLSSLKIDNNNTVFTRNGVISQFRIVKNVTNIRVVIFLCRWKLFKGTGG